jgi:glycosyltransferase involved in cell wall biosynthesis
MYKKELTQHDFILFEDMFHPGIESLFYVMQQQYTKQISGSVNRPFIGMRCLAQTLDPDDFVYYTKNYTKRMSDWMRHYEYMVNEFIDVVFMASQEMVSHATIAGWNVTCVVTGLSFGKQEVLEHLGEPVKEFYSKTARVVFASRLAREKQPEFFLTVAEIVKRVAPEIRFAIVSGGRISYPAVDKAVINYGVEVYPNLTKQEYYKILNDSRILFNCSLQDWVSNTLSEADTLGCNVLFPAYRSFPEALFNSNKNMYVPWSTDDAVTKLLKLIEKPTSYLGMFSNYQDKSIERTVSAIEALVDDDDHVSGLLSNPQNTKYRTRIVSEAIGEKE